MSEFDNDEVGRTYHRHRLDILVTFGYVPGIHGRPQAAADRKVLHRPPPGKAPSRHFCSR
jgi:hypothetical protein